MKTQIAAAFEDSQPPSNPETAADSGANSLRSRNERNRKHQATQATRRTASISRNLYYYRSLSRLLSHLVVPAKRSICINAETGFLLDALKPAYGVAVDVSEEMVRVARGMYPHFRHEQAYPEDYEPCEKFDYVLINNIGDIVDVQKALLRLRSACERHTRVLIYGSPCWA